MIFIEGRRTTANSHNRLVTSTARLATCGRWVRYAISRNMVVREEKVLLSEDRLGRVAIVKRADGLFCLYAHWRWDVETQRAFNIEPVQDLRWTIDYNPELYYDTMCKLETKPRSGIYGSLEDAEKEARSMLGLDRH